MQSLAARLARQAGLAASHAARRRGVGAAAPARWRRGIAGTSTPVMAVATPVRLPGLTAAEPAMPASPAYAPMPATDDTPQRLWQAYLMALERRPLLTKAATSFFCVCVGDSVAQLIGGVPFSALRVMRLATYSSVVGATVGHHWHRWLEARVHPEAPCSSKAVVKKTLLDQFVLSPVMLLAFFAAVKVMEGQPADILPYVQSKYVSTLAAGYALWIPYNVAAFKWIPQDLRILAANTLGLVWGTFLSLSCVNSASASAGAATAAVVAVAVAQAAQQE